jgi:hypothetical protein
VSSAPARWPASVPCRAAPRRAVCATTSEHRRAPGFPVIASHSQCLSTHDSEGVAVVVLHPPPPLVNTEVTGAGRGETQMDSELESPRIRRWSPEWELNPRPTPYQGASSNVGSCTSPSRPNPCSRKANNAPQHTPVRILRSTPPASRTGPTGTRTGTPRRRLSSVLSPPWRRLIAGVRLADATRTPRPTHRPPDRRVTRRYAGAGSTQPRVQ